MSSEAMYFHLHFSETTVFSMKADQTLAVMRGRRKAAVAHKFTKSLESARERIGYHGRVLGQHEL